MATKKEPPSRYVTVRTFANAVGIAHITARRWVATRRVKTEPINGRHYILATEIDRHLADKKEAARNVPKRRA
jgi:predicted site-specific integrase-resolvase